ncbi:hypothetical protein UT300005_32800 [Clostridium sp. CTA-5]
MAVGLQENELEKMFEEEREIPDVWLIPKEELEGIQNTILNDNTYNFTVEGPAGSGKTVLATYKFLELIALHGSEKITLVVYTLALMEFIKNGLENTIEMYKDEMVENIKIDNLNILSSESKDFEEKICNDEIEYILVDESQDMKRDLIVKINNNIKNLMFFGDDGQTLYKDRISMAEIKNMIKKKINNNTYNIDKHYRVSKSIMKFAECIIERNDLIDNCYNKEITYKPIMVKCNKLDDELNFIMNTIKKYDLRNVGIFVNNEESIRNATEYFEKNNYGYKYKLKSDIKTLNFNDIDNPTILTYHSSKGLQFDTVFVTCCDNKKVYATKKNDELKYRNSLFVACTRAKRRLYITYHGILNEFMINISSNLYNERIN